MNITGIIAEYNPFHKGHLYHINKTKELTNCDAVVVVMSGNFVQRGIPSLIDKWNRADWAVLNGADLVIELPCLYSLSSAEFFAYGSVSLLESLGVVNNLSFGSECGDPKLLYNIAKILTEEPENFKKNLKEELNKGFSYAISRSTALTKYIKENNFKDLPFEHVENLISSSNNILGIEYCKSLIKLNSKIIPFSVKREGGSYNSTNFDKNFSSASSIRKFLKENKNNFNILREHLPNSIYSFMSNLIEEKYNFTFEDSMLPYIKYKYFTNKDSIRELPDISEGIENRIFTALDKCETYNSTINFVKTKRYAYTRISRILCQFFLNFDRLHTQSLRKKPCPYARILSVNSKGLEILKKAKKKSTIPIYSKIPKNPENVLALDLEATKLYSLLNKNISPEEDYIHKFKVL